MITINRICMVLVAAIVLSSCNKDINERAESMDVSEGGLAFVNASEDILWQIKDDVRAKSVIMIDRKDTAYGRPTTERFPMPVPAFTRELPSAWPSNVGNDRLSAPWIQYMRLNAGRHEVILMDTAHNPIVTQQVELDTKTKATVYLSDIKGHYSSLLLKDTLESKPGYIGLRFINFCADADIFFTVNGVKSPVFPASMKFGEYSAMVQLPAAAADTFKIKLYRADAPETMIARTVLYAETGHGYTAMINGYTRDLFYKSPFGNNWVTVIPNPRIKLFKNY